MLNFAIVDLWIRDLVAVGYQDIPNLSEDELVTSPCIGRGALSGVYYHPAPATGQTMSMTGTI